ncbi:GntR family transcriptional regulator [Sneathiella marina]|uniref:GntR family transcriptional regulator n=1 Tax=Sneathiella marina TaxID=2950108 RepID=A0ABY4WA90_9PROT|nr:GntR family transcriptional regulator [Sneathiella marina]USG61571.1 GntR family transcriptional regulator [Sneathiella marina]
MLPNTDTDFLTKTDLAKRHIQTLVLSGVYAPGDRITTREVARALGISDTPIREAFQSLASEGWLQIQQHVGAIVQGVKVEQVREISRLRGAVGGLAIEIGWLAFDEARLQAIDDVLDEMQLALDNDDYDSFGMKNYEFHDLISDRDHAPWCRRFLDSMYGHMSPKRLRITPTKERMAAALQEHRDIQSKLREGEFAEAARRVEIHERNAGDFYLDILAKD